MKRSIQKPCIDTFFRIYITVIFCELPGESKILDFRAKKFFFFLFSLFYKDKYIFSLFYKDKYTFSLYLFYLYFTI
jgi:hypothetical protein